MTERERTYSIWPFLAVFLLLGAVGLAGILVVGNPTTPTETIPAFTTTSTTTPSSTAPEPAVTVPGGAPAPDGVKGVVVADGTTTYNFRRPAELSAGPLRAAAARSLVTAGIDGSSLVVGIACTLSDDEVLARIAVTESTERVDVTAVVVDAEDGATCSAGAPIRQVEIPLAAPLAGRPIAVAVAGTPVAVPPA